MNNSLTTFYIVRHGQSEANTAGKVGINTGLTEKGKQESGERAKQLQSVHFDFVYSSSLLRAKQSAEILALEHKLVVKTTDALRERDYGSMGGKTRKEIKDILSEMKKLPPEERVKATYDGTFESEEKLVARVLTFLREVAVGNPGKTILIVSHGNVMRTLLIHLGFATFDELPPQSVVNTGYIKLETDGVDFFIKGTEGITKSTY